MSVRSNGKGIRTVIKDNRLSLYPDKPREGTRIKTTLTASANGQQSQKSFTSFLQKESIAFGKRFELKGKIRGQKDIQSHPVILSGKCRISGNNGYRNQAFFTSVKHRDKSNLTPPTDKELVRSFPKGIYYLTAALVNGKGRYYPYQLGKGDEYQISVECSSITDTTEEIGRLLGI